MATEKPTFTPDDEKSAREAAAAQAAAEGILEAPGSERNEALARKAEKLIAAANKLLEQMDVGVAADNIVVEREVRQAMNDLNEVYVSNAQSEYAYCWQFRDPRGEFGGRFVRKLQALGYEVVQGQDPEAVEHKFVDGTRVVADCILMRIRVDRKALLEKRDRMLREAQQAGIDSRIRDLAERAGTRVYDKLPGFVQESLAAESRTKMEARAAFHRLNATGQLDRQLRTGTVPGGPRIGR